VRGVFVTGTDTGVGKTLVTAAVALALQQRGLDVAVLKPVQTGDGDAVTLKRLAGLDAHLEEIAQFSFSAPVAPLVAARLEGIELDPDEVAAEVRRFAGEFTVVEGVGGLLCPMGPGWTIADLAARLSLPLLLVARADLGTVNHTLLTVAEARRRGLEITGVVLNGAADESTATNAELIESFASVPVVATVPWLGDDVTREQLRGLDLELGLTREEARV
jgi:dethiobiotin synthetase